jgi:hypothetical protein
VPIAAHSLQAILHEQPIIAELHETCPMNLPAAPHPDDNTPIEPVPVVRYVRMSTEHQRYTTARQQAVIHDYAERRGFKIIRAFEDATK